MKKLSAAFSYFFSNSYLLLGSLLLLLVVLRIPNFFEPYWYGDEAIYLSVGLGMNNDMKLYTDIVDHKTPLIYYFARTPDQLSFRILTFGWMIATTILFFVFSKKIFEKNTYTFLATLIFILLTTLPRYEGNIPNGEMFVMGFVMVGAVLLTFTDHFASFIDEKKKTLPKVFEKKESLLLFFAGVFFGLGILTKVPGLLDLAAFLSISWFIVTNSFSLQKKKFKKWTQIFFPVVIKTLILFLGVLTPIVLSIMYFVAIGSGKDYLDYGLLYNLRYSGSWQPYFESALVAKMFTLPGKTAILALFMLVLTFGRRFFSPKFQFIAAWFGLTVFATLLSNRPYPHYFIQIVPAFALLISLGVYRSVEIFKVITHPQSKKIKTSGKLEIVFTAGVLYLLFSILSVLNVSEYPTRAYYERFYDLATQQITKEEYDNQFNHLVSDNKKISQRIKDMGVQEIFIWGTNPMLYAKSKTVPTSRYTVSFHIKDFDAYDETFDIIKEKEPKIIVVMKDEDYEFTKLNNYLAEYYAPGEDYDHMTLFIRYNE